MALLTGREASFSPAYSEEPTRLASGARLAERESGEGEGEAGGRKERSGAASSRWSAVCGPEWRIEEEEAVEEKNLQGQEGHG